MERVCPPRWDASHPPFHPVTGWCREGQSVLATTRLAAPVLGKGDTGGLHLRSLPAQFASPWLRKPWALGLLPRTPPEGEGEAGTPFPRHR